MKHMYIYRIRDRNTEKFSNGGANPDFTKEGKIWNSAGTLRSHISMVRKYGNIRTYINCEVVEYILNGEINYELTQEIEKAIFKKI